MKDLTTVHSPTGGTWRKRGLKSMVCKFLRTAPLFQGLTADEISRIEPLTRLETIPGQVNIIRRQHHNDSLYCLLSGTVRIGLQREDHRDIVLGILGAGEVLGDISALDGRTASASVTTLEECKCLVMAREEFMHYLRLLPQLAVNTISLQTHRMRRLTAHTEALASLNIEARLARQLLVFAKDYGVSALPRENEVIPRGSMVDTAIRLPLRLTQGDLAALCGSSLKQINRAMITLQTRHLLEVERGHHIVILKPNELRASCPYDEI